MTQEESCQIIRDLIINRKKNGCSVTTIGAHLISCKWWVLKEGEWVMGLIRAICLTSAPSCSGLIN